MRTKMFFPSLALVMGCLSCAANSDDVKVVFSDGGAVFSPQDVQGMHVDSDGHCVFVTVADSLRPDGASPLNFILSGNSNDAQFILKADDGSHITLDGLTINSRNGAPLCLRTKKPTVVSVADGTDNRLTLEAIADTAKMKSAVIWSKDDLTLEGKGKLVLNASADGCKGINAKKDLHIDELTLAVATTGDNLGVDTTRHMGPPPMDFPDDMPPMDGHDFHREGMPDFPEGRPMPPKGMPTPPEGRPDFPDGMPGTPDAMMPPPGDMPGGPGFGGKQKYMGTCKGIKAGGKIVVAGGKLSVSTRSRGAEGIEGKEGVRIDGGTVSVKAMDDAINSNGRIVFAGGETTAWSLGNDGIDSNSREEGAISILGGRVTSYSQCGPPEEAFDCDMSPIAVKGGTAFGIGAGMGDMGSVPTEKSSEQPTVYFMDLDVREGDKVELYAAGDMSHPLATIVEALPFTFGGSSSLFTSDKLKAGASYVLKVGEKTVPFTMKSNFQTVGERWMKE